MPYYSHSSGAPVASTRGVSSSLRAEFDLIQTGFTSAYNDIQTLAATIGAGTSSVESSVASATTTTIGTAGGNIVSITGTNTISSFGSTYNGAKYIRFTGSLTLLASASLVTPSGANITTQAGDACIAVPIGNPASGWRIASYERMSQANLTDDAVRKSTASLQTLTGNLTSPTLTGSTSLVMGAASNAGLTIQTHTGGVKSAIYSNAITPSATNYSFLTDAASTALNAVTSVLLAIAGTTVITVNSSGMNGPLGATTPSTGAFTTLSATSSTGVTSTTGVSSDTNPAFFAIGAAASQGSIAFGTNVGYRIAGGSAYGGIDTVVAGTTITHASSTGLAVTGALSAAIPVPASGATGTPLTTTDGTRTGSVNITGSAYSYAGVGANEWWQYVNGSCAALTIGSDGAVPIKFVSNGALRATLDTSGNLGLGVTPSAWKGGGNYQVIDLGTYGSVYGDGGAGISMSSNSYINGSFVYTYKNTAAATRYTQTAGTHQWHNAPSGTAGTAITFTQAMTLDASGNLGLGVTPSGWGASVKGLEIGAVGDGFSDVSNTFAVNANIWQTTGGAARYGRAALQGSSYQQFNGSHSWYIYTGNLGAGNAPSTATQAMTLDASGNLLVGVTSSVANAKFYARNAANVAGAFGVSGTSVQSTAALIVSKPDATNTTSQVFQEFFVGDFATGSGQINANGASACAFGAFSDRRLKENITSLPSQLGNILALRPVEFDYIESEGGGHQIGFIAQEVREIYPDLVGERADGMLTLTDMNKNDARLIKALQEVHALVTSQQALIESLTTRLAALEAA